MGVKINNNMGDFFNDLERAAKKASGKYTTQELFSNEFLAEYTTFKNIDEIDEKSPVEITHDIPQESIEKLNVFIAENTKFSTWQEFIETAGKIAGIKRIKKELGQ